MAQWAYRQIRIEQPREGNHGDVTPEVMRELNRLGADGWEVCSVLDEQDSWLVLLKQEVPPLGAGGAGGAT